MNSVGNPPPLKLRWMKTNSCASKPFFFYFFNPFFVIRNPFGDTANIYLRARNKTELNTNAMKKHFYILLILILGVTNSQSQITFQRTYGTSSADYGHAVVQAFNGDYFLLGDEPVFGGAYTNSHLIKTNQYGDTIWTKSFGDSIHGVQGWDVYQVPTGELLLKSGYNQNIGMNIIKIDTSGTVIWNKMFANSGYYSYGGIDTAVGGGYVFLGQAFSFGHWNTYVLRTDVNGDSIWGKSFGSPDTIGLSIKATTNGYVICGGSSNYPSQHNVLMKIDTSGNRVWTRLSGGTAYDIAYSLATTNGGGFVLSEQQQQLFHRPKMLH
ncbi:MAG: hypothetical protein IPP29_10540 [Bacteroidetes bacterium]|nr:hypothetical protein [Bacteroidota bacterium]